ncbi:MAG: hypothetical protein ACJATI_003051 [Halioglobus sp.]|jgi:hypothetical protein
MYRSTLLFIFVLSIISCQQTLVEEEPIQSLGGDIPAELTSYFRDFQEEAGQHGVIVDYDAANVTAEIQQLNQGSVAGTCSTNGYNTRHITIDKDFWNKASHSLKEMIIFHELGHCILGRGHKEDTFENGVCQSIMRSGLGSCKDAYVAQNRAYFISELFAGDD